MAKKRRINFEGVSKEVKRGGSRVRVPEGDYVVKIVDHSEVVDEDKRFKGFRWNTQIVTPAKYKGKRLTGFTSIKPEALWSLRNLIHAAVGKNVAGKAVDFDPAILYGKIVGAEVTDNEYKGKVSSQINSFFPKDEVAESDEDEDEDEDEEDLEDEDEEEEEDLEDVDVEDL